ncbi:tRNA 5-hydroxyuridine modification protein YegQ [Candidatus Venteria ishoeyi]|uniref:prephenate-dependent tRNA uridine(34) hydroxylase TrhP n=1 Tax=Candidatus Venteria ishoeyi TaxID=1899563 RepID=UPI0025A5705F|nr:tRNA 5-hydroxyuridine modification protein YegQ [Candidatus Venteria ishoeyi]MDM8547756.1 tRNA 5-hydroxyuridine modification protein YegQ [Candidatus Venteria ishoeyi]
MKKPELLAPAGTLKNMRYALAYGADAVYAGQPRYSLRVRNNDFNHMDNLALGIAETHAQGKQFFVAANISPHNSKLKTFMDDLAPIIALNPDALIMADPGLIMWVRERWPDMPIHLSVQANTVNYAAVQFWQKLGLSRVILSRELALDEVKEIRQQCPDIELEVFVHGALCIAYSGRCLLSGYLSHRDPNQGSCTNTCRWDYKAHPAAEDETGDIQIAQPVLTTAAQATDQVFLLEEHNRPGEYMPAFEDEHGTYIMNSKDLRAVQHVAELIDIGVDCLKIEGRTKSHYYAARTSQVYRHAIDDAMAGKSFDFGLMDELENLANRGYTEGFYRRHLPQEYQNYEQGISRSDRQQFVGEILSADEDWLEVDVKNHFEVGDQFELMLPGFCHNFSLEAMQDKERQNITVAKGSGHIVWIPKPAEVKDIAYGLLLRDLKQDWREPVA